MIPVVTPAEMRAIDEAAPEPAEVLVERAGAAVARAAIDMLGGTYGRRVVVVAGKGNNGADGRCAARRLARRGVRVEVADAADARAALPRCDLVIDAAYGTGFRGEYHPPRVPDGALVLSVDIPSGVDGLTGAAAHSFTADATVTFAALKPGLVFADPGRVGIVTVADIGLDASGAGAWLVEPDDVWLPPRSHDGHKYDAGVAVVAGSPGMTGAPVLCARAALRAGSGYVRLAVPGLDTGGLAPAEAVAVALPPAGWAAGALGACERMRALALGPGLGRQEATLADARSVATDAPVPAVVDGDGLTALGTVAAPLPWPAERVLTPHDGEFGRLAGEPPGADRIESARALAARTGATVLLKGSVTTVAAPDGRVLLSNTGGARLATAGTGDVLTGIAASFLAQGLPPLEAAAFAACVHGLASRLGPRRGLVAGDLVDLLTEVLP